MIFTLSQATLPAAFIARGSNYTVSISSASFTLVANAATAGLTVHFVDANPSACITAGSNLGSHIHHYQGNDESSWREHVPTYGELYVPSLYPGIQLKYESIHGAMAYSFSVSPGADVDRIKLELSATDAIHFLSGSTVASGEVVLTAQNVTLRQSAPIAYQVIDEEGECVQVEVAFQTLSATSIGFRVGAYNVSRSLFIDPILYATYLGGAGEDQATVRKSATLPWRGLVSE